MKKIIKNFELILCYLIHHSSPISLKKLYIKIEIIKVLIMHSTQYLSTMNSKWTTEICSQQSKRESIWRVQG